MTPREAYIKQYAKDAQDATSLNRKIFPETVLTVAILESTGNVNGAYLPGMSKLATDANNHFGIKVSTGWNGDTIEMQTTEVIRNPAYPPFPPEFLTIPQTAKFRKYATVKDSYKDFVKFLTDNPRYAANGLFEAKTPGEQFQALQRAGYATNPQYASLLNTIYVTLRASFDEYLQRAKSGWGWLVPVSILSAILIFSQSK